MDEAGEVKIPTDLTTLTRLELRVLVGQLNRALRASEERIKVVEGERDRQYEFNAGQIIRLALSEDRERVLREVVKQIRNLCEPDSYGISDAESQCESIRIVTDAALSQEGGKS